MADGLTIKDYLETATDAAKRVRTTIIILVVATVLLFSGFLNSFELSWMFLRLQQYEDRNSFISKNLLQINYRVENEEKDFESIKVRQIIKNDNDEHPEESRLNNLFFKSLSVFFQVITFSEKQSKSCQNTISVLKTDITGNILEAGTYECNDNKEEYKQPIYCQYKFTIDNNINKIFQRCGKEEKFTEITGIKDLAFFEDFKAEKKYREYLLMQKYSSFQKSVIENSYVVKLPFFGVTFDINDIGFLGGLGIVIILSMLRLSLKNYILSLRIGIKAARNYNQVSQFYDVLASRQLFAFPTLKDENQTPYTGWTEQKVWEPKAKYYWNLLLFNFNKLLHFGHKNNLIKSVLYKPPTVIFKPQKDDKIGNKSFWVSTSHSFLQRIPFLIFLLVFFVYAGIVINDWASFETGLFVNKQRTWITVFSSLFFLLNILFLELWCISKWAEIYNIWNRFLLIVMFTDSLEIVNNRLKEIDELTSTEKNQLVALKKQLQKQLEMKNSNDWYIKRQIFRKIKFYNKLELTKSEEKVLLEIDLYELEN